MAGISNDNVSRNKLDKREKSGGMLASVESLLDYLVVVCERKR